MNVTVITSTIGRPELKQCIESVRAQSISVRHMVLVNGAKFHDDAKVVLESFPEVESHYLTDNTGDYGAGPCMADCYAAGPFLTRSDWVCFLDDDNWFDPDHIESLLWLVEKYGLEWAYSLRRWVAMDGTPIGDDDWQSLGYWPNPLVEQLPEDQVRLVDTSCFFVKRRLAQRMSLAWTAAPFYTDRGFLMALMKSGSRYGCTGLSSVNYRTGSGAAEISMADYTACAERAKGLFPDGFPWRKPMIFDPDPQPIQVLPPPP